MKAELPSSYHFFKGLNDEQAGSANLSEAREILSRHLQGRPAARGVRDNDAGRNDRGNGAGAGVGKAGPGVGGGGVIGVAVGVNGGSGVSVEGGTGGSLVPVRTMRGDPQMARSPPANPVGSSMNTKRTLCPASELRSMLAR